MPNLPERTGRPTSPRPAPRLLTWLAVVAAVELSVGYLIWPVAGDSGESATAANAPQDEGNAALYALAP